MKYVLESFQDTAFILYTCVPYIRSTGLVAYSGVHTCKPSEVE